MIDFVRRGAWRAPGIVIASDPASGGGSAAISFENDAFRNTRLPRHAEGAARNDGGGRLTPDSNLVSKDRPLEQQCNQIPHPADASR